MKSGFPPRHTREDDLFPVYRMHYGWFPRVFPGVCAWLTQHYGLPVFEQYIHDHGQPDVIHAHNVFYGGYLATQISQRYAIPTVLTEHASNHIRGRIFLPGQKRILRQSFKQLDAVLTVSETLRTVLLQHHANIDVVDNIVNTDNFTYIDPPSSSLFVFSSVGSLRDIKNFPLLIRAFAQAFRGQTQFQLRIAGDGPDRSRLETLIQAQGMASQIQLTGRLEHDAVRDLFQQSHVVVSSSLIETFGVTLIEAMACGRPVIATRSGGPEGFINVDGVKNGLLVANNDVDALASGLKMVYDTYDQFDLAQIRSYCVDRFSEQAIVQDLLHRYRSLV